MREQQGESLYRVIGMMSGTSLDGVDLSCCIYRKDQQWSF
jgi:1,6-anhydro-N-acetylmuramate kinase